jgi:hypothetical protein
MSTKVDKRQLYFDRNRKNYIEFDLEKTKNCMEIYDSFHEEIEKKINDLYNTDKNKKMNFSFIMMYSRTNKLDNSGLIELKLDKEAQLSDIMINKQYFLCYLPENKININQKRKTRNKLEENINNDRFKDVERRTSKNHELEKYLTNEGVYYLDKEKVQFLYGKGTIDENTININCKKANIEILIKDIKKEECFENKVPPSIEDFKIKCPNFIFQIHQNNITHFLGLYKQKSYLIWKNAINLAKIKNNDNTIDSSFNSNIFTYNYLLYVKRHSIPSKCYIINQLLENAEKRQIFLDEYKDKKISDIANSIYAYKINIKNNKFFEAWMSLKQISFYVDFNNIEDEGLRKREKEKYSKIFTQERIDLYNNAVKKVNEAIKTIKNYEKEMNNVLKKIFEIDLFDNLYYNIYELYIWPYFQKIKNMLNTEYGYDQKPEIIQKFHLLLSRYCANYFDMNNMDNFNCLCVPNENNNNEEINNCSTTTTTPINNNNTINSNDVPSNDKSKDDNNNNNVDNKDNDKNKENNIITSQNEQKSDVVDENNKINSKE